MQKSFGPVHIIKGADLDIDDGEFVVFVGPSGCGKSTLLRLIAGLEDVSGGKILIDGKNVVDVPPAKRGLSMVFQSYALYPHMSVRGNIAFGLKMAGLPKDEINRKVEAAAATLNLTPLSRPQAARAFRRPAPARRDRPRHRARAEGVPVRRAAVQPRRGAARADAARDRRELQKQLDTTTIYVTHDQVEAMTMADKIVVLSAGQIEQIWLAARALRTARQPVRRRLHRLAEDELHHRRARRRSAARRPSACGPSTSRSMRDGQGWPGKVVIAEHLGSDTFLYVDAGPLGTLTVRGAGEIGVKTGDQVALVPDPNRIHRFDANGNAIFA